MVYELLSLFHHSSLRMSEVTPLTHEWFTRQARRIKPVSPIGLGHEGDLCNSLIADAGGMN